jgi:hypothetical protein
MDLMRSQRIKRARKKAELEILQRKKIKKVMEDKNFYNIGHVPSIEEE